MSHTFSLFSYFFVMQQLLLESPLLCIMCLLLIPITLKCSSASCRPTKSPAPNSWFSIKDLRYLSFKPFLLHVLTISVYRLFSQLWCFYTVHTVLEFFGSATQHSFLGLYLSTVNCSSISSPQKSTDFLYLYQQVCARRFYRNVLSVLDSSVK